MKMDAIVNRISGNLVILEVLNETPSAAWVRKLAKLSIQQENRTLSQNALIHVFFRFVANWLRSSDWEIKAALKEQFLKCTIEINGEFYDVVRDTAALTKEEFSQFYENCRLWAIERDVDISKFDLILEKLYNVK